MLEISDKAKKYLEESEQVQDFNSVLVNDDEGYKKGVKMSLVKCVESILGKRKGTLQIDNEGNVLLNDGEREFTLVRFFCGYDYDTSASITLLNKNANYTLHFSFPIDDKFIDYCRIQEQGKSFFKRDRFIINKERHDNSKFLEEVESIISKKEKKTNKRKNNTYSIPQKEKIANQASEFRKNLRVILKPNNNVRINNKTHNKQIKQRDGSEKA